MVRDLRRPLRRQRE